jgi:hypothetical protein
MYNSYNKVSDPDKSYEKNIGQDEVTRTTNKLLEDFKQNYVKGSGNDFVSDAITNMIVCCRTYEKIFEGFIIVSQLNKLPQELIEGFVKWSNGQLEELKEKIQEIDKRRDMR